MKVGLSEILLPFLWLCGWVAASIWYRRSNGKPIIPQKPANAIFCEDWCSGRSLRNALTRVGGASNCLLVYVADNQLVVTPRFPFTLMFLPEVYSLDLRAPVASIASVEPVQRLWGRALRVVFHSDDPSPIELRIHDERGFIEKLGCRVPVSAGRPVAAPGKPRRSYRLTVFRLFMAIWGMGAFAAALSSLPDDYRFRRSGIETTGVFDSSGVAGDRSDMGVLSYSAEGRRYQLTSIRGNGLYKPGEKAKLFYLPGKPDEAREAAYLPFDLVWLFLGMIALGLALFSGRIANRIWR